MQSKDKFVRLGLINLSIVALIGVIMRYKIGFEFPYFDQKYLLHGHSHFAFAGWVSHLLFVFFSNFLVQHGGANINKAKYKYLIYANLGCAYGMLIAFILHGYGMISIFFSSCSVLIGFIYGWHYITDSKKYVSLHPSTPWFNLALIFNVLSSVGTFSLAFMMVTKNFNQHIYLGSIYYYLHFQYSGWFFFGCMGLFLAKLDKTLPNGIDQSLNQKVLFNFGLACLPAYLLSVLWLELPWYIYSLAIVAVLLQFRGLWYFIRLISANYSFIKTHWQMPIRVLYTLSFIALIIKLNLQGGSTIPEISKLAFGFRSIVIAYLHLVLLGIVSFFLLGYVYHEKNFKQNNFTYVGLLFFCTGVFLNELFLMIQGVSSFSYTLIPYLNETLFVVSIFMLFGLISLVFSYRSSQSTE